MDSYCVQLHCAEYFPFTSSAKQFSFIAAHAVLVYNRLLKLTASDCSPCDRSSRTAHNRALQPTACPSVQCAAQARSKWHASDIFAALQVINTCAQPRPAESCVADDNNA